MTALETDGKATAKTSQISVQEISLLSIRNGQSLQPTPRVASPLSHWSLCHCGYRESKLLQRKVNRREREARFVALLCALTMGRFDSAQCVNWDIRQMEKLDLSGWGACHHCPLLDAMAELPNCLWLARTMQNVRTGQSKVNRRRWSIRGNTAFSEVQHQFLGIPAQNSECFKFYVPLSERGYI